MSSVTTRDDPTESGRRRRDRASAMIESSLDCVVTLDTSGIIVEFNPAAERVFGWSREEALGRDLTSLIIPEEFRDAHRRGIAHHLGDGATSNVLGNRLEVPAVRRDGSRITVELMVVAIEHDGEQEYTGFMRDVTELRQTQAELRASQQRYESIVRHSTRALILCAPHRGECLFLAGTSILGYPSGSPLAGEFVSLVHPDDADLADDFMARVRSGEVSPGSTVDLRLRHADGSWIVGEVSGEDLTGLPSVDGLLLAVADVTADRRQQRQLADVTAQMRTLIDNLGSAVLLEDVSRRVLVANNALVDLFAMPAPASDIIGTDFAAAAEQVQHVFTDPAAFVSDVRRAREGLEPILATAIPMADGRTLECDYLPIRVEGRAAGNLWVFRDVTLTIAQQEFLKEQNRSLEQLSEMKTEFVARASHELRSPLTSVVSFTDLLADPQTGPLNDQQSQFVEVILRNAERLLRLIEDLLLVAKLESRTLPLSLGPVDPLLLATQVTAELAPVASNAEVALSCAGTEGPRVNGDDLRLQQVVSNLVNNAITYTPAGGRVDVRVEPDRETGRWRLTVSDTGLGVDHAELPHLFDAFFRASSANSSARTSKGTGLGLAIVRLIVEEHGGTIEVASTLDVGTSVTVWLPFDDSET